MIKQCEILNHKFNPINKFSHIQIKTNATLLGAISKIEANKIKFCFVEDKDRSSKNRDSRPTTRSVQ